MAKLGSKVDANAVKHGVPPVVLQAQPNGHIKLTTPAEIKQWEEDVKSFYGITIPITGGMHACETCTGGCSDDCGLM
jgi:hypothetical protein